jgi:hypothetical protein
LSWAGGSIGAPVRLSAAQIASATERSGRLGGAGGILNVQSLTLTRLDFTLAGAPVHDTKVPVNRPRKGAGRIGSVVISQLDLLLLDFDSMTIAAVAAMRE